MLGFPHFCAVALQMADHINIHQTCIKDYRKFRDKYMFNGPRVGETFKYKNNDVYFYSNSCQKFYSKNLNKYNQILLSSNCIYAWLQYWLDPT